MKRWKFVLQDTMVTLPTGYLTEFINSYPVTNHELAGIANCAPSCSLQLTTLIQNFLK